MDAPLRGHDLKLCVVCIRNSPVLDAPLRGHDLKQSPTAGMPARPKDAPLRGHDLKLAQYGFLRIVIRMPPCGGMT